MTSLPNGTSPRLSFDTERTLASPPPLPPVNGASDSQKHDDNEDMDPVQRLQRELERTKEEKDKLAAQYQNLLTKLTAMRTTLGNKLKQDAEELDRQEQLVQQLTAQNEDLANTVETLKSELIASNEEAERASRELEVMRSRALLENTQEAAVRERELRELQQELEECRLERDEWQQKAMEEHISADDARMTAENLRLELESERDGRQRDAAQLASEREQSANLQSVLADFQAAKEHELQEGVKGYESQLMSVTQSLAEFKHRALTAELNLEESSSNNARVEALEKEVKEKNLLIGKLRHEAVIMNEHLMEALRRLRQSSTETNVDGRLVTNVLLSFITTPRADPKRFEMLSLLATILSWSDDQREKAGLQRKGSGTLQPSPSSVTSFFSRATSPSKSKAMELDKTDETESFSRLWVEFLLTEAAAGEGSPPPPRSPRANSSMPSTPTRPSTLLPPALRGAKRLPSWTASAMASTPDLALPSPPTRKGKEKALADP